ncbi:hypothetical protein [Bacillus massiliigorillae]|uniref:hypothetical protein n=1 Tax=Bacillus massiliigorillae TaxID=1243664 RepID=UPI0003A53E5B|nr:hypothetical protein [Bacillus massiliigorillae]
MKLLSDQDRDIVEQFIYLPMILTILENDKKAINTSNIKIKEPYLTLIEDTMKKITKDLKEVKMYMGKNRISIRKGEKDELFTSFHFNHAGHCYEAKYFNPQIKNRCNYFLNYYLNEK